MNARTRDMCIIALMTALICVVGPNTIPIGPIPVTLANFMIYLTGALLGRKKGTAAVALYLLIGLIGLPVFSGYTGGFGKLVSPTFGYLLGDIPCVFIVGYALDKLDGKPWAYPLMMVLGTAVLYTLGTVWYSCVSGNTIAAALSVCVVPFIALDLAKMACASVLAVLLRRPLEMVTAR